MNFDDKVRILGQRGRAGPPARRIAGRQTTAIGTVLVSTLLTIWTGSHIGPASSVALAQRHPAPRSGRIHSSGTTSGSGMAAIQRTVRAYQSLGSLRQQIESDIELDFGDPARAFQSTELSYTRQPVRLAMRVIDPVAGTQAFHFNGSTLTWYRGVSNQYCNYRTGDTMQDVVKRVDQLAPQLLSPLEFLSGGATSRQIGDARITGRSTWNGASVLVVSGTLSDSFVKSLSNRLFKAKLVPAARAYTLWIDENNHLVRKVVVRLAWSAPAAGPGAARGAGAPIRKLSLVAMVKSTETNVPLAADLFRFTPPAGATETREMEP